MTFAKKLTWAPLARAAFLFLQGPSSAEEMRQFGDAYVSGTIGDARVLVPFLADDSASGGICEMVFNGLTKVDKNLNIVPDLSERWDIQDGGKVITFYLRKDVKWHDGAPFTAEDVRFTFEALLDPKNGCPYIASHQDIERIEILDAYTIRFMYRQPYAPALLKLGMGIIPKHILEGKDIRNSTFKRSPIGTGPYRFKRWKTDEYIILESNKEYFEHRPYIDTNVTKVIPDQAVQYLELISGSIDSMGLTPYQYRYRAESERFKKDFNRYKYLAHAYTYIGYNMNNELFKDKRVRQALSYAIDKNEIIDGVLMGLGEVCTGPFIKDAPYYNTKAEGYPYNPEKAKQLFREAGWRDTNGDGILERNGKPFKFKLITNQGNKAREDVAALVQRKWRQIGIDADVQIIAWASFINEFVDKKNFDAVILGWTMPIDPDCENVWHSEAAGPGGLNFISYKNEEVDRLIMEGRRIFDVEARGKIYRRIHELIAEDAPYAFLFFPYATPAISKRFKGIEPAPAGIGYNFIDWYVTPDEMKYSW